MKRPLSLSRQSCSSSRSWWLSRLPRVDLRDERGDVPGWVLVTLMTAGLVVALWTVAGSTLTEVFLNAIAKVTSAI
ncbi:hypothetical protein [Actinomyces sp. ZJ308]|uniref:hypothetical protein n=1 Tax=Actinomyces sp. ZJ308 TaxID=2708342 RepID=UPI00141D8C5F|nr:hypothetical protein [Actinomyces sp. ZJ308]